MSQIHGLTMANVNGNTIFQWQMPQRHGVTMANVQEAMLIPW